MVSQGQDSSERMIRLTAEDGFTFDAFEAIPEGKAVGGLVVIQEIFGMTDQLKSVARAYARDGYHTILPALFDRASPGTVVPFDEAERGRDLMLGLNPDHVLLDLAAAIKAAETESGVSVVGFCWGGGQAYRAACAFKLTSAVAFYGTRLDTMLGKSPQCPTLFHFGETDSHTPPELVEALQKAVPDAEIHLYPAGHAFANDARPSYVQDAAELARMRTMAFLTEYHQLAGKR